MTDLLEQMKTRAEQAQTAYEAYKAECEKAEELPERRPMTRKEVLAWASSEAAFGWVVRKDNNHPKLPQHPIYNLHPSRYTRAPIATLNNEGTGGEWEAFEVQA